MTAVRVVLKMTALLLVTATAALVSAVARLVCLGRLRPSARAGSRTCSAWSRLACGILRIRRNVRGKPGGSPFLVAANHVSYLDIWVLSSLYPCIFVAKREISRWPVFGWVARTAGTLFVDREAPRDVVRAGEAMTAHLRENIPLTVFPEGGTSHGELIRPFMSSILEPAARAGVPCYAASISYETPGVVAPPSRTICWSGGKPPFLRHLVGLMKLDRIEARVSFSEVPVRSSDRKELARRLWEDAHESFVPIRQQECAP